MIDRIYRTSNNLEDNIIMGSSMGGLISLYALVEYPDIFGGAGCLSTHWPAVEAFILPYLRRNLPESGRHKIYFDHGTQNIDADYSHYQKLVDEILVDKGYSPGKDWVTHIAPSANHHEDAWRSRLHLPLRFLLGKH